MGTFVVLGLAGSAETQAANGKLLTDLAKDDAKSAAKAATRHQSVPLEPK